MKAPFLQACDFPLVNDTDNDAEDGLREWNGSRLGADDFQRYENPGAVRAE